MQSVLSSVGRLFFVSTIRDFHCGLRGLSKEAFHQLDLRTTGMEFASEMIIKATLLGLRIAEVPTTLSVDGRSRRPHLRPYRDGWRHLRFMLLFSPNWLFLYPGMALVAAGILLGTLLLRGPVAIGPIRLSLDTLIYCSAMIGLGVQAVLFAVLSRIYRRRRAARAASTGLVLRARWHHARARPAGRRRRVRRRSRGGGLRPLALARRQVPAPSTLETILRVTIGSSLGLSVGSEIIFSSFLLSTLKLGTRTYPAASRAS